MKKVRPTEPVRLRAYRMRIYPDAEQEILIRKTFGCSRFVFNNALKEWNATYESTGKGLSYVACSARLTQLKTSDDTAWLCEVDSTALQASLENLADAWDRFFKKQCKKPNFKSKKNPVQSYTSKHTNGNIRVGDSWVRLPKLGCVRAVVSLRLAGRILRATVSRRASGRFYVSVLCEESVNDICANTANTEFPHIVALDLGVKTFATMIDNAGVVTKVANPKHFAKLEERLAVEQRKLSAKTKFSGQWFKQRRKVARVHERIADARRDMLQKLSTCLVNSNDVIVVENLSVTEMLHNAPASVCAKSIADVGWSEFRRMLEYKCEWYGKRLVVVDRYFPSSRLCSHCGFVNKDLADVSVREWTCPDCGERHDRDINAAKNLLNEGIGILNEEQTAQAV